MKDFTLRKATLNDIKTLEEFEQNIVTFERQYIEALKDEDVVYYDLEALILSKDAEVVVVCSDNKIVGSGFAEIRKSTENYKHEYYSYLGFMYVDPEFRGKGINTLVLDYLKDWSKSKQVSYFSLDVYADNKVAIKSYEKVGFKSSLVEMTMSLD